MGRKVPKWAESPQFLVGPAQIRTSPNLGQSSNLVRNKYTSQSMSSPSSSFSVLLSDQFLDNVFVLYSHYGNSISKTKLNGHQALSL